MRRRFRTAPGSGPDPCGEAGFTLVELMAALTILAVGIVGTIGVMNSSIRVAGTTGARSKGVAVATQQIEALRAVPYDQLVPAAAGDSYTTTQQSIGNRIYTVKRVVTLVDEATPGSTGTPAVKAYKKAFVWVSWSDESGVHDVHQTTLIYPGGKGRHNPTATATATGSSNAPDPPTYRSGFPAPVTGSTDVDLAWTPPAPSGTAPAPASWVVQYAQVANLTNVHEVADALPAGVTELRVGDLSANTTYRFRVFSKSASGVRSTSAATADVTTGSSSSTACSVGSASVTPAAVNKKSANEGGGLAVNPRVAVSTLGSCSGVAFRMEYSTGVGVTHDKGMLGDASGTHSELLNGALEWTVGTHEIRVFSYVGDTKTRRATLRLTVCAVTRKDCS